MLKFERCFLGLEAYTDGEDNAVGRHTLYNWGNMASVVYFTGLALGSQQHEGHLEQCVLEEKFR